MSPELAKKFSGSIPALMTPFKNGAIDKDGFARLVEDQIAGGSAALVVCGTTGEAEALSEDEHAALVETCVKLVRGRVPVIAGASSNATAKAVALARLCEKAGADALLVLVPYYVKPAPEGQYGHFKTVHDATGLPIFIYNNPGRAAVDMQPDIMARLAQLSRIVGVKDATGDLARPILLRNALSDQEFCQLSGDDATALGFLAHGGQGCISVTANIAPHLCAQMQSAWVRGDHAEALAIHRRLMPLHKALFVESSPAPLKYSMHKLGGFHEDLRLPLAPVTKATRAYLDNVLEKVAPR